MLLNATKASTGLPGRFGARAKKNKQNKTPDLHEYIRDRDWTGAIALLEFNRQGEEFDAEQELHLGYACAHLGDYKRALDAYDRLLQYGGCGKEVHLYRGVCLYFLQQYDDAEQEALRGPPGGLQNRLLFHVAHKQNDENKLMMYHQKLTEAKEDQLALAAIHFLRSHFQESTDIYKRLLLENRDDLALNVYVAMSYYRLVSCCAGSTRTLQAAMPRQSCLASGRGSVVMVGARWSWSGPGGQIWQLERWANQTERQSAQGDPGSLYEPL